MSPYQTIMRDHRRGMLVSLCMRRGAQEINAPEALGWLWHFAFRCSEDQVREDMRWLVDRGFARYVRTGPVPSIRLGRWQ